MDKVQLRHFDYLLDIGAQVGTLAAGQRVNQIPLRLDTDSSFILRGRAVHYRSLLPMISGQAALVGYLDRFCGPDEEYLSQDVTRFFNECVTFGQYGSPLPVRSPLIYPPGGVILVDVNNDGRTPLTGLELYFRGSKIFQPGVLECHTYPEKMSTNPFIYSDSLLGFAVTDTRRNQIKTIQPDADFVARALTIGSMNPAAQGPSQYYEVHIQLKDWDGRAYSNLPVHIDACFGACGSLPYNGTGALLASVYGPYHPPLFTPEIYIPASRNIIADFYRNDAYIFGPAASPVDLRMALIGAKVYPL